jgi:hypothetical protein|nr:MAG TPA: hypothetical protein [Caudoviricetes sp.]
MDNNNNKWISIKERKPDRSRKNILVKTRDGRVGFAYYQRYLPKDMEDVDLPREEFLEKAEQFFTGIPVEIIDDMVITKRYNPEDIEYWMDIEDAVDRKAWRLPEEKIEKDISGGVLLLDVRGEVKVGVLVVHRDSLWDRICLGINPVPPPGKRYKKFYSICSGTYEDLMFLRPNEYIRYWQYLSEAKPLEKKDVERQ